MIELKKINKKFDKNQVIKDVSLKISEGEIVGFLGPNGAGKTTTVRMIAGVLPPTSGEVCVNGNNLFSEESDNENLSHIGYLPENNPIYDDMTVEEFLKYWANIKKISPSKTKSAIDEAAVSTGLEDVFYRPISELSKGYRQRTGLAQAILAKPDILLLDEPTEGLDPNQRRDIHNLLKGIGKKRTVIICSHVLPEITKMCSRVVIINHGQIVADSHTSELSNLSGGKHIYEILANGKTIEKDLKSLNKNINLEKTKEDGVIRWTMTTTSQKDFRLPIFELAKKQNWDLYELTRKQQDLEDVFASLTKE
jgi:ABC-2 type transport system ATP-binding protein